MRADFLESARGLVFVCSGNMLRSAFAELWARHRGVAIPVRSIATTYRNDSIHPEARAALLARGVARELLAGFHPTHIDDMRFEPGWRALGMTQEHLSVLVRRTDLDAPPRLLRELEGVEEEIADPLFDGRYDQAFATIARCIDRLVEER